MLDAGPITGSNTHPDVWRYRLPDLDYMLQLIQPVLPWFTGIGILMAVASMAIIPWLVVLMPEDYFVVDYQHTRHRGPLGWTIWSLRNLLALLLILAGIIMLVLPGQGLLTILIGVSCSTFPGKYRLQRRIAALPKVLATLNWVRKKYHRPLLQQPNS